MRPAIRRANCLRTNSMNAIASLVILAAAAGTPSAAGIAPPPRHPDAIEIFSCTFDGPWDVNYDGWPDSWNRVYGPARPRYVEVGIQDDDGAVAGKCLAVHINGGGARVESPLVAVSASYSYVVQARVRLQQVKFARARLVV